MLYEVITQGMIGAMSSQALASMITLQLSKTLGTQLNLDMIEIIV